MKQGEVLNGYTVATKPTNANGGKCLWAFADRGGQEFFIKEFLEPKWPLESSPGSVTSKERRRTECLAFEQRHQHVMNRLKSDDIGGGNIVIAEAFFREATTYYKVTKRIDASNLASLAALTTRQKAVVLRTLALSLQQLHRISVVHGDLKPDNVLVQKRPRNDLYTAKLIDFDDSYLAGEPPEPGTVAGDTFYGAPEWLGYIKEGASVDGATLTTAVDMFALGLMLHEYLTGQRPGFPAAFSSPGQAVEAGQLLTLNPLLHPAITRLVQSLTDARPQRRPRIEAFLKALDDENVLEFPSSAAEDPAPAASASRSRLQINIRPGGSAPGPAARPASSGASSSPSPAPHEDDAAHATRRSRVRIHVDSHIPEPRAPERGTPPPER
jgi:serine/threonine protein kinase